eukprot:949020-Prymnesium_polylepis.1
MLDRLSPSARLTACTPAVPRRTFASGAPPIACSMPGMRAVRLSLARDGRKRDGEAQSNAPPEVVAAAKMMAGSWCASLMAPGVERRSPSARAQWHTEGLGARGRRRGWQLVVWRERGRAPSASVGAPRAWIRHQSPFCTAQHDAGLRVLVARASCSGERDIMRHQRFWLREHGVRQR